MSTFNDHAQHCPDLGYVRRLTQVRFTFVSLGFLNQLREIPPLFILKARAGHFKMSANATWVANVTKPFNAPKVYLQTLALLAKPLIVQKTTK